MDTTYANPYTVAAQPVEARAAFIRKTYTHLAGAVAVFALLEAILLNIPGIDKMVFSMQNAIPYSNFIILAAFLFASHLADKWARSSTSISTQYMGLGLYIVALAILSLPSLLLAQHMTGDSTLIVKAGGATAILFLALTLIVFTTRKDFSFLGGMLKIVGLIAIGLIVVSIFFPGFVTLGLWFSVAMVVFVAGSILYNTSNIIHHYQTTQYVAASLGLFASVGFLFLYILRIFMSRD